MKVTWWLAGRAARLLESDERDAVLGDVTELRTTGGQALLEVIGLVMRRQSGVWADWRPWLALVTVVLPVGILLGHAVKWWADSSAIYAWLYVNNWTWGFLASPGARADLAHYSGAIATHYLALMAWSWTSGFVLGSLSRRTLWTTGTIFALIAVVGTFGTETAARRNPNSAVFSTTFYGVFFPLILKTVLVLFPAWWGMRRSMNPASLLLRPAIVGGVAVAVLTWWTSHSLESSLSFWRGAFLLDAGRDRLMGTADDPRTLRLLALVMMWPAMYIVAVASWRRWRDQVLAAGR